MRPLSSSALPRLCLGALALGLGLLALASFRNRTPSQTRPSGSRQQAPLNLVGRYYQGGGYGGPSLNLLENGHYELVITSDTEASKATDGDYTATNGVLTLSPHYSLTPTWAQNSQARRTLYFPVRWGARLYLIPPSEGALGFCNAVNLGDEPVPRGGRSIDIHVFMMRAEDGKKAVTGKPQLPAPWNAYLLPRPVNAKILRVQRGHPKSTATINVGSANNIRVGMNFIDNRLDTFFTVIAVKPHQAILETSDINLRTGAIVSTRRTHSIWNRR